MKIAAIVYKVVTLSHLAWNQFVVSKMKCSSLESVGSNVRIGIGAQAIHWHNICVKDNVIELLNAPASDGAEKFRFQKNRIVRPKNPAMQYYNAESFQIDFHFISFR